MKKKFPAFLAALLITAVIGAAIVLIGQDALGTSTARANSETLSALPTDAQAQIEQSSVQYQTELTQAIDQINAANQQLDQANQQIQQYQNLLSQLQENGLITINDDGTVIANQPDYTQAYNPQFRGHPEGNH